MSEQLKYVVSELNKAPFNRSFNLISFDSLEPLQLLQVLTDVLAEIDPKQKLDVREEAADQTAVRIFGSLRVLKYKPPTSSDNLTDFRQGVVQGNKNVIHPVLEWLLQRIPELRKRAYIAQYLVKVEVPPDFMADEQMTDLYEQYERLIDTFKKVHRESEQLKSSGFNTSDIKKDISSMEEEKEHLIKRVERLKKKVEAAPNSAPMLDAARNLRAEKDREEKISKQKAEQKNTNVQLDQRIHRLQQQIKDAKNAGIGATPQGLLHKLEEESKVNQYMLKDKLPKEIATRKKAVNDLQRVVSEPAMGQADLDDINEKIKQTNSEINQLVEKLMVSGDPIDDKLSLFRQQATIISRKKESAAETLREARDEYMKLDNESEEKRQQVKQSDGGEVLKGEEFKRYVNKLRSKSTVYKKKRSEMAELRAETGVLSRTEEILKARDELINQRLSQIEDKHGVSGFHRTQEALENVSAIKSEMDQMKGRTLEDISHMVQQLTRKISDKKSALAPIIKELRPMRQKAQELTQEYEEKKSSYDAKSAGYESNRSKLEQEVRTYREEIQAEESRFHYINSMRLISEEQQKKMQEEMKAYTSSDPQEKKKTLREQYSKYVQTQENLGKGLREKQKYIREQHEPNMEQMKMWKDFSRLMECKMRCMGQGAGRDGYINSAGAGSAPGPANDDMLVL